MDIEQWLYSFPLRLRSIFHPNQVDQEMKEELRFEGVLEFMRLCQHNPKFKVRSLGFTKFVK